MAEKKIQLSNLIPGKKYAVRIRSISSDGNISDSSPTFSFTTIKDITPPLPVTSASADFSTPTLILTWDSASSKQSRDFKNFQVTLSASGTSSSFIYFTESPLALTFEENYKIFNGAIPKINFDIKAQDNYGNFSESYSGSASNIPPSETPVISASAIFDGFYASWSPVSSSFNDYSYTEIYSSSSPTYNASAVVAIWRGTSTAVTYSKFAFNGYNTAYIKARHFDIFNQPSSDSNTVAITPLPPVTLTTTPPANTSSLTVTALNDSTGTTAFSGQIIATWIPSLDSNSRGYRLRVRQIYEQFYQYENTASNVTSYHIGSLIPGETYEVGIAAYDQFNNTSSYVLASPSAITIPYGTASSQSLNASATQNSNILVLLGENVSASMIGQLVSGYGLVAGTIITGSISGASATISPNSGSAFSGSLILYPGMSNWRSYITAGTPTSTSSYMKLGTGVNGTQSGLYLNNSNYWYTSGNLRVGTGSAYLSWDGNQLTTSGNIVAKSGSFDGNVQLTQGSLYAGSSPIANPRIIYNASGIIGYTSSGSVGFILDANTGNLYASNSYVSGSILATSGFIGGTNSWAISNGYIKSGAGTGSVTLDGANNKIYIGTGTYNNSNTPFYVDGGGQLSLGTQLVWSASDSTLAVKGTINGLTIGFGNANSSSTNIALGATTLVNIIPEPVPNPSDLAVRNLAIGSSALYSACYVTDNIAIGYLSQSLSTNGRSNVALGPNTLLYGSSYNIAIGASALVLNQGAYNIGIGVKTLSRTTTGTGNIALGQDSLLNDTTGNYNVGIGYQALRTNLTGIYNIAIGSRALYSSSGGSGGAINGDYNIAIGNNALYSASMSQNNIAIGLESQYNVQGYQNISIGKRSLFGSSTASNNIGNDNIAFGFNSLYNNTSGTGNLAVGNSTMANNLSGNYNTAIGKDSLGVGTIGSYNVALGYTALAFNDADNNTAIGAYSQYKNSTGSSNISMGYFSLYSGSIGSQNIAIGYQSLYSSSAGDHNIAMGDQSLYYDTSGSHNIAIGYKSLYNSTSVTNNIAIGNQALLQAKSDYNVAMGYRAGYAITSGSFNTFIGINAASTAIGNYNTVIGSTVGMSPSTLNGIVAIGTDSAGGGAIATSNNQIVLGTASHTTIIKGSASIIRVDLNSASISGSAIATQSWVQSQGYGNGSSSSITASAGTIGGWNISASNLYNQGSASSYAGIQSASTASYAFFAGGINSSGSSSQFSVTPAGNLTANSASIVGVVTFTSGTLGNWTVSSGAISSGSINGGSANFNSASISGSAIITTRNAFTDLLGIVSSSTLAARMFDETGSGSLVFSTSPIFTGTVNLGSNIATGSVQYSSSAAYSSSAGDSINLGGISYTSYAQLASPNFTGTASINGTPVKRIVNGVFAATGTASFGTQGNGATRLNFNGGLALPFTPTTVLITPELGINFYMVTIGSAPTSASVLLRGFNSTGSANTALSRLYWAAIE